jgi:hypothetical protein
MTGEAQPRIVKWPSDDEVKTHFEAYALAVGRVAHAWNYLQEALGQLFVLVVDGNRSATLAVWYSTDSDRTQRNMLRAALVASGGDNRWAKLPSARRDLLWLIDRANALADQRNNAIHTPASLSTDADGSMMTASHNAFFSGHPRARRLWGKKLITEFEYCEKYAEALYDFARKAETALGFEQCPWPD